MTRVTVHVLETPSQPLTVIKLLTRDMTPLRSAENPAESINAANPVESINAAKTAHQCADWSWTRGAAVEKSSLTHSLTHYLIH